MTPYSSRYASQAEISKFIIPQEGAPADAVHQMLKDELDLDGRPNLNLASFVGTYMEREAEQLMIENLSKNMSDADEYPAMMAMHSRCVSILSHLYVKSLSFHEAIIISLSRHIVWATHLSRTYIHFTKTSAENIFLPSCLHSYGGCH